MNTVTLPLPQPPTPEESEAFAALVAMNPLERQAALASLLQAFSLVQPQEQARLSLAVSLSRALTFDGANAGDFADIARLITSLAA
jgi:hypothetical protein